MSNPYYFPFEVIDQDNLIPNDKYYIKLNDNIIRNFANKRKNIPVSHLEGVFVRLHTEQSVDSSIKYAVFKNVKILNKEYKEGLCNMMLVRYPDGFLASADGCSSYSDFSGRSLNEDREVYFPINKWIFGKPTEHKLLSKQIMNQLIIPLGQDNINITKQLLGEKGGKKRKMKKNKRTKKKFSKKNRTRRIR
jgi:hypothetical protein